MQQYENHAKMALSLSPPSQLLSTLKISRQAAWIFSHPHHKQLLKTCSCSRTWFCGELFASSFSIPNPRRGNLLFLEIHRSSAMAAPSALLFFLLFFSSVSFYAESRLTLNYYAKTCPDFDRIIRETVTSKQITSPTTAAGTLRLFFHDCMVGGCDASILISSNSFNKAERDSDSNLSLPGDAFDVIIRAKTALELSCPGIVSCSDILAQTTRDLVTMVGGPFYKVRLGRKDGLVSQATRVESNIPHTQQTTDDMIKYFTARGFTVQEFVALSGGHTIGFSHCKEFSDRLFNYSKTVKTDPEIYPKFAESLKQMCANQTADPAMAAFNDVMTPGKFDNMYYQNLIRGLGLLASDHALIKDPRTKPIVELYAADQTAFFRDFSRAMEKVSVYGVKTGRQGEVRRRCDLFNRIKT